MKNKTHFPASFLSIKSSFLTFSLLGLLSFEIVSEDELATFDPMDVFELEWAIDPRVSPDGETIVYVRRSNDIMKDR